MVPKRSWCWVSNLIKDCKRVCPGKADVRVLESNGKVYVYFSAFYSEALVEYNPKVEGHFTTLYVSPDLRDNGIVDTNDAIRFILDRLQADYQENVYFWVDYGIRTSGRRVTQRASYVFNRNVLKLEITRALDMIISRIRQGNDDLNYTSCCNSEDWLLS